MSIQVSEYKLDKWERNLYMIKEIINDEHDIDFLRSINCCNLEEKDSKWILYKKVCYYGGCNFDPEIFDSEYEALKKGAIISITTNVVGEIRKAKNVQVILADVNRNCKRYYECSGRDD